MAGIPVAEPQADGDLRRWFAEFRNPDLEQRFLTDEAPARSSAAQAACVAFVATFVALGVVDAFGTRGGLVLVTLLGVRALCIVPAVAMVIRLRANEPPVSPRLLTALAALLLASHVVLAAFEPEAGAAAQLGMTVLVFAVVALGTTSLGLRVGLVVCAEVGWLVVAGAAFGSSAAELASLSALSALVIGVAATAAYRIESVQRREWVLRQGERELVIRLSAEIRRRERVERDLVIKANVDVLTTVPNRRHFLELADVEYRRAQRSGETLSIVVLDVDHFKVINDTWGHASGDEVLKRLAHVLRENVRRIDVVGRLGGEEFAVLMPGADIERAAEVMERICTMIRNEIIDLPEGMVTLTVSAGIAETDPWVESIDDALARADAAMYRAKFDGRDRFVLASS